MMRELRAEGATRLFKAGRFWNSNVFGAALAGGLGGLLMLGVMGIVVLQSPSTHNIVFAAALGVVLVLSVLCFISGNLIAAYPYAVSLDEGRGIELCAPIKSVYILTADLRDVRKAYLQPGYVVRLKRRHRLLKAFLIPWYFGDQAEPLANAIREEIRRQSAI